jgi:hypothetical protein
MLEVGNGGLTDAQSRTHFGLWALMKSPLILGTPLPKLSPAQLAIVSNKGVIAINKDPLAIQGKKLAVNGLVTPRFVGLAPCSAGAEPAYNGVSRASLVWAPLPSALGGGAVQLYNNETNRCLAMGSYFKYATAPLLFPCNASDPAQAWLLPNTTQRMGGLLWYPAATNGSSSVALSVADSTLYAAPHGPDVPLPDANYGLANITLAPYAPQPPCSSRSCDNYAPSQMWYWSSASGKLFLGHYSANDYRCFGPNCYQLTGHLPTYNEFCLAHVLSYDGNVGTGGGIQGESSSVWGGPLSGVDVPYGDYVLALANHNTSAATLSARFAWLEVPGVDDSTSLCGRELFSNASLGVLKGGVTVQVGAQDIAMIRFTTAEQC